MGCMESSEVPPDEIAAELYRHMSAHNMEAFEGLAHSALWHQGRQPDWAFIRRVLSAKIVTTSKDWKETLIHYAVRFNEKVFLDEMMQYDPDLNAENSHGNNILHTCCVAGASVDVFALLTKELRVPAPNGSSSGAPPSGSPMSPSRSDSVLDRPNEDGDCPIHLAARNHFGWLVEMLLELGAMRNATNREGDTALRMMQTAQRNPLARGNATAVARKKTTKIWWDRYKMHLPFVIALLEADESAQTILQNHITQQQNLLDVAGAGEQNRSSGSFEMTGTSGGGSANGGDGTTLGGSARPSPPLAGAALGPNGLIGLPQAQSRRSSNGLVANSSQNNSGTYGVKSIGSKRLLNTNSFSGVGSEAK
ncbi:ankyrin repeat protein, putative [Bodo saltans]|uniref:Ankyrin repeat protein, putative n=1 Tax=Bodo saltans TaxID=75058 RepID=A0A0S4J414_BODSA|nr:ankyrin repeat protein, putative [Bodo saltans]|eukprot:CUG11452.1 ankyrin repeat protein, putative [Bodo saltans]